MAGLSPIALVGATAADVRDVMIDGPAGIVNISPSYARPTYEPSKRRVTWPNGAYAIAFSAEEPDRLRGPQHAAAWCDELAAWSYATDTWDMLQFGMRIGIKPRTIVTTTPRPIPVVRRLMRDPRTVVTRGSTKDNAANLSPSFYETLRAKYEGTRLGRQELDGELLDDLPGALWTRETIERAYHPFEEPVPEWTRVVIGVDPSGSDDETGNMQGIVVAARGEDGRCYVLADKSTSASPDAWGRAVVKLFEAYQADRVVAEANYGGEMVKHVIKTAAKAHGVDADTVPVTMVTASRGKHIRAEPIAALYEQGRVRHCGTFAELEEQMTLITGEGWQGDGSPDRLDALVWAVTALMLGAEPSQPRVRRL